MKRWWSIVLVAAASVAAALAADGKKSSGADALFNESRIRTFKIEIPPASLAALRQDSHGYVRATVQEGDVTLHDVGIRLKGHGTFQPVEKKPSLAIKFNEFASNQEYRGLTKLMLNNSALDPSYIREWLATQVYRDAGIPAARATHARVVLNGRELGFYVLVEAMNKGFFKRELGQGGGNLYEGESKDIDQKLDQENGDDTSQNDLKALLNATRAPLNERLAKIKSVLDVDEFASFLAVEMLTAGIDSYAFTKNNYRVFHQAKADKLLFLPHGLDATFGSAGFVPPTNAVVVKALWPLPEFREKYHEQLSDLAGKVWNLETLTNRVNIAASKLTGATTDRKEIEQIEREAKTLRYQIEQQAHFIGTELKRSGKE